MLINCTNHPFQVWNEAQREAAAQFGEVVDLPFPQIEPHSTTDELRRLTDSYAQRIEVQRPEAVLVAGEFTFAFMLVDRLLTDGVRVLATRSRRITQESLAPDGTNRKSSIFVFECFQEYARYEEDSK